METNSKPAIYHACRRLLRPIASMVLRCGMTWKEFSALSKAVFVHAASEEFGVRGRATNISRVSILTGISRKEVRRQRDLLASAEVPAREKTTDATKVLSGWYQDPEYLDEGGAPALLAERGPAPSFESLCARYSGEIAMPSLLKELLNTHTIERNDEGLLRARRRYYQPAVHDDENLAWAASLIRDLVETSNHDVFPAEGQAPRFLGKADDVSIPADAVAGFRDFMNQRGQAFLEEVDNWLAENRAAAPAAETPAVRLGVGLFTIEADQGEDRN